jgi:hypothetical protein
MNGPIMKFFAYAHLPTELQQISKPIGELAEFMDRDLPDSAEKTAGLRKLLEAKDCFVRAKLPTSEHSVDQWRKKDWPPVPHEGMPSPPTPPENEPLKRGG